MHNIAVIWDMDGVIIDSIPLHYEAWKRAFSNYGVDYSIAVGEKPFGHSRTIKSVFSNISNAKVSEIAGKKEQAFKQLLNQGSIEAQSGVLRLIKELQSIGIRLALASSNSIEIISIILEALAIIKYFDIIISSEDVKNPKPHPEIYLKALSGLGVTPENACVIEDMPACIAAVKAAGIHCIAVATNHSREKLKEADMVVNSISELTAQDVISVVCGNNGII